MKPSYNKYSKCYVFRWGAWMDYATWIRHEEEDVNRIRYVSPRDKKIASYKDIAKYPH